MTLSVVWAGLAALPVVRSLAAAHAARLAPARVQATHRRPR